MSPESSALATALLEATQREERITPSLVDLPSSLEEAEAIQDALIARLGPIGAWKLGATTAAVRELYALPRAFLGAIPAACLSEAGTVRGPWRETVGVECEYAFRLSRNLPPGDEPVSAQDVASAIGSVHPALEIPASRFPKIGAYGGHALIADNGAVGWAVVGPGRPLESPQSILRAKVRLLVAGQKRAEGTAAVIDGMPLDVIVDFVRLAHQRGYSIGAGQYVLAGSCTGYSTVALDTPVSATFEGLGSLDVVFSGEKV